MNSARPPDRPPGIGTEDSVHPESPGDKRPWYRRKRLVALVLGAVFFLSAWLFIREAKLILKQPITSWLQDDSADCAVVLTGGPHRIREGVDLLTRKAVQKLIISGVHPQASFRDIFPLWPFYGDLKEQDIILERRSETTYGNAQQTLPLVEALRCRDIILITSRVHMRRALFTFRAEYPADFPIIARATISYGVRPGWGEVATETLKALFYSFWAY